MSSENKSCCNQKTLPAKLRFKLLDYFKVLYSWLFAFKRTFIIKPGLYYTGEIYDINAPLLVTCNYHMTVFVLWRILKLRHVRLLVIDTQGINVWCSSGKGQFSTKEITRQIVRYDRSLLTKTDSIQLILPKLSLSGVSLSELKKNRISPKIGPVYAADLPAYLEDLPLKNRNNDKYIFSLKDRMFTLIPSLVQMIKYGIFISAIMFIWNYFFHTGIYWQVIPILFLFVILYVTFFPLLPSKKFCIKGLFLYVILSVILTAYYFLFNSPDALSYIFYLFFTGSVSLFFSLSYTGNSGVSNYSLVKKEIVRYLPVTILFVLASVSILIIKGVNQ